ncbi:MAG: segregation/condensation protein A [Planctomycetes bacterium]|nr:segregation/condensation protein A [Planctomycetota bacterium]
MSYRVELPVFCGPLDLLLHLVKQQELDIHEIRIAAILDQYLKHLELLRELDLQDLGDFLVMASTLMEIKSREMLPNEAVEVEQELDPRDDLIRRLLEYKRYRDVSRRLERLAQRRARMIDVALPLPGEVQAAQRRLEEEAETLDLGEVEIWTLTAAFAKLLEETGRQKQTMEIGIDRRGMHFYVDAILQRVRGEKEVPFVGLFDRKDGRLALIGTFIAILEMMKQGVLRAWQGASHGEILVVFKGGETLTAQQILAGGERLDEVGPAPGGAAMENERGVGDEEDLETPAQ